MRIYLKLSNNQKIIPFNYQELLTGVIHKWIGESNEYHGKTGQFSFSWIQNTKSNKNGINLEHGAYFFISSPRDTLIKELIKGILEDPEMFCGINVTDVHIENPPQFSNVQKFLMASPVLVKVKDDNSIRHVTIEDEDFEEKLTVSFKNKLEKAGISSKELTIQLDPDSSFRTTKLVDYKGIKNRASLAPIVICGNQEQIEYAWSAGIGNSTGIGFGALK